VGLVAVILFAFLNNWPLIFGLLTLILGYLYSFRGVRLKTLVFFDVFSHCLMLAGLQFLCGYFTYTTRLTQHWFWPFTFVMSISIYGELYNEIRDLEGDRTAQLRHTAIILGDRASHILMLTTLVVGIFSGAVSFIVIDLIPLWVFAIMAILAALFVLPPVLKLRRSDNSIAVQGALQKPLERAASIALLLQFILPWLDQVYNWELF
jgi:4-hydroxybenzoate polyprenyltransferase